ncbi:antirepressor [Candidatus Gottesmanbacteria bacterium RIFCSPHIGHO2_01_FULL_47_48]|uniref:Antirepressor n=1 Tax=Candidatus Gottesmanbacteria bacterium RIFCSPHIGHO2_01_FULL_47_48 TaxID=1798381 RepID=A0A1F6A5H5_9BACT|nr:MAG: antirepressor [Candidatus Gottesmanbacteria bacterium RIFCSPHIGHO2_01_FULL_47_48]
MKDTKITIFEGKKIRRHWDEKNEKWWFSVTDIVSVLTRSVDPLAYWRKLKQRLNEEGSETVTKCHGLKMLAADGKRRLTDVADTEIMLRIIQSIPSPQAEPFKLWLARVGYERIEEAEDPEKAIQRAMNFYLKRGYSKEWVNQRLKSIEIRKELTDEWENRGIKGNNEFAILTDIITFAWAGMRTKDYKQFKGLKKENLRDNMTNLELVLNMLAEATTTEISKKDEPKNFSENQKVAREGGAIAGSARRKIEKRTGKKVVSKLNAKNLGLLGSENGK